MEVNHIKTEEFIAQVVVNYLNFSLEGIEDEDIGISRFMLDCLTSDQVTAICLAILEDSILSKKVEIKVPEHFVDASRLPSHVLTRERTTYFRNANCDKEVLLVSDTGDDERLSLKDLTPIGATQLLSCSEMWVDRANVLFKLGLDDKHKKWWQQSCTGLLEARTYSLDRFANYLIETSFYLKNEGEPLLNSLGLALPALRLPKDKLFFTVLNEKTAAHKSRWESLYKKVINRRGCYLLKQTPSQSLLTEDQLLNSFQKVKDSIDLNFHDVIQRFCVAESGWNDTSKELSICEWESIAPLFDGIKPEKFNLGKGTIQFFDERYPELLEFDDQEYLIQLSKRNPKSPEDEDVSFFEKYRQILKEDGSLKVKWDKLVFGSPVECEDFLVGIVSCLEMFFDQRSDFSVQKKLTIRSSRKTKHDLKNLNFEVALYFATCYKGLGEIFNRKVEWDFGELFDFENLLNDWRSSKTKLNRSKSAAATQIKFYLDFSTDFADGTEQSLSKQLIWKFNLDGVPSSYSGDLSRLSKNPFLMAFADREPISGKGKAQSLDLHNTQTLHACYAQDRGSLIPQNKKEYDIAVVFQNNLRECKSSGYLSNEVYVEINELWQAFQTSYRKSIVEFSELGFTHETKKQVKDYACLLELIGTKASGDRTRRLLLKPLLKLGCAEIRGGAPTCIITPWHPLRMLAGYSKTLQVNELINKLLTEEKTEFSDPRLFFKDVVNSLEHPFYPEIAIGWRNSEQPELLSNTDYYLGYSLHESPIHSDSGTDEINENPKESANLVLDLISRYLQLYPHERANLSTVLYNCDSARLPQAVVTKVAEVFQDNENLRCEIMLRHRDSQKLCDLYEEIVESSAIDEDTYVSSEATSDFMARLRIAIMADQAELPSEDGGRPTDIVFLDDVIARHATLEWYSVQPQTILAETLRPSEWSRRRPSATDDMKSIVYLASPVQAPEGWKYLAATASFFKDQNAIDSSEFILPARQLDFQHVETRQIFDEVHKLGNWVANFDELLDRRQLQNQDVRVIRYKQTSNHGRNTLISSRAPLGLLKSMVKQRMKSLNVLSTEEEYNELTEEFIHRANMLSGDLALRAARRGKNASELVGIVLSQFLIEKEFELNSICGWYSLDDYAEWLGQKEEQIADLMALKLSEENGNLQIGIIITEAKYIEYPSLSKKSKESQKQLSDTVNRINNALFATPHRGDRSLWISRLCNLMCNGIHLPSNSQKKIEDWIKALQKGECDIYVRGYSHVFVSNPVDSPECTAFYKVPKSEECYQEVFSRSSLRELVIAFAKNLDPKAIRQENAGGELPKVKVYSIITVFENKVNTKSKNIENSSQNDTVEIANPSSMDKKDIISNTDIPTKDEVEEITSDDWGSFVSRLSTSDRIENANSESKAALDWLNDVAVRCKSALQNFQLKSKLLAKKLTPNCAILDFEGSSNLRIEDIKKRQVEFLTSFGINIISVRPLPGVVSISITREDRQILLLQDMWKSWSPSGSNWNCELLIGIKEEDNSQLVLSPIKNAPHTLVAGSTGSGKSVLLQNIILTIAATNHPKEAMVKIIDPKRVSFNKFKSLPHLDGEIIKSMDLASEYLNNLLNEMDNRYTIFEENNVEDIFELKKKTDISMPFIWVIHDEFALWMLDKNYSSTVETVVNQLAVAARAAGIYLIFAAQRPDKDVFPMQLRSNLGNRLVLKVDSPGTSTIALGNNKYSADKLLGNGHMIADLEGSLDATYVQVPFAPNDVVAKIVKLLEKKFPN